MLFTEVTIPPGSSFLQLGEENKQEVNDGHKIQVQIETLY